MKTKLWKFFLLLILVLMVLVYYKNTNTQNLHQNGINAPDQKQPVDQEHYGDSLANRNPTLSNNKVELSSVMRYDRDLYEYDSYQTNVTKGFYTERECKTSIDHIVSLRDAHQSGGGSWEHSQRKDFANDRINHVPSCARINSSKGASLPKDFIRKSNDGRGMEYEIKKKCKYLELYSRVKRKYSLSFNNNDPKLFDSCGLTI